MQLLKFIPIKLTFCLVVGILLGHYYKIGIYPSVILTILSIGSLAIMYFNIDSKKSILFGVLVVIATFNIGIFSVSLSQSANYASHYSHQNLGKRNVWRLKVREVMKPTEYSNRYVALVRTLNGKKSSGKMLLNLPVDSVGGHLMVDDELLIYAQAQEINAPLNPHQFDYKEYLESLGITHQLRVQKEHFAVQENASKTVFGIAASLRNRIINQLKKTNFGEEELGIIQALLLGQRHDISETTYNNYKNAGAVHILAVSGLHIGILLLLLQFLLRPLESLPKGKTIKLIVIVVLLWGFAILAGLFASIIRAVTMFSFVAYALYLNRPSNTFNILALSMFFILLLFDPKLLFQVGFQMSYAAVFAIVWIYPLLQKLWFPKNKIVRYFWQLLSVSIAAQLGVLPISLFYFHQFPGLFFISNLLIIPVLGLILGMGVLVILLALANLLPEFLARGYNFVIELMNDVIGWVAQQEAFVFQNIPFDRVQLFLAYLILFSLILVFTKPTFKRTASLLFGILLFQSWMLYSTFRTQAEEHLIVAHQNRNSILLHQSGRNLVVNSNAKQRTERLANDYKIAERIAYIENHDLKNSYSIGNEKLLIIDRMGIYPKGRLNPAHVLLTESPKINLERLIDSIKPKKIIADGSNYKSYIQRWQKTCTKRKLPFHYTGEKGAYYFEFNN
ncbi:ComEC/Rec2 family competence protein [Maribacter halichondriae]|uniref:ComEC/Rec2 family competence protein n=1 Tax=Maribacter halichondriae TaxID=2980554 RepID=UPI00235A25A4|nr:ComEC/Rec2 family competence protein [Maribacter sp. Hal144]